MKKTLSIIAALILASCGGNTNQNNNNGAADTTGTDGVHTVSTTDTAATQPQQPKTDLLTEIAVTILKDHLHVENVEPEKITNECHPFNNREYKGSNFRFFEHPDGNFSSYWYLYFYPKKSGGYEVVVEITGAGGDAYEPSYSYKKYLFQNDKITQCDNVLDMKITDFYSNSDKFPKEGAEAIKTAIIDKPFFDVDSNKIAASFDPSFLEGDDYDWQRTLPEPLKGFLDKKEQTFPIISYIWDGEHFVPDPKNKPYEEDLKYFGVTNKGGEFAQSGKTIAELYSGNKDSLSIAENDINGDGKSDLVAAEKHGGKLAVYWGGDDGYTLFKSYKTLHNVGVNIWDNGEWWIYTSYNEESEETTNEFKRSYHLRFQDGDFYLIGGITFTGIDIDGVHGWPQCYGGEFDLEKHTKYPAAGGDYDYESAETLKNLPLKKLSDIAIGEYNFSDYNE